MIVKKMPILQGFPQFQTVKNLSERNGCSDGFSPVFYDIETTGLSRNSTFCYLIGAAAFEANTWQLYQWLAEDESEEPEILSHFIEFMKPFTCTIQYNGNHFDQPYLESHFQLHDLENPFEEKVTLDLYQELKPLKGLLKLPGMKQPQLETFLGISSREYCDGGACIRLYRDFSSRRDEETCRIILGHNQEDLLGLGKVFEMLGYLCLTEGNYSVSDARFDGERLLLKLDLPFALPREFSNGNRVFYITGRDREARLSVCAVNGQIRQYYENYKDYYYLPGEDTAIPRTLGTYLDKSLRKPAKKETCYTWFDCTGDFLVNKEKQMQYLSHSLVFLLGTLK